MKKDIPYPVLQQAAEWYVTLADEAVSEQDTRQWQEWLAADSHHRKAWHYVEVTNARFHGLGQIAGAGSSRQILEAGRSIGAQRRRLLSWSIAGIGTALLGRYLWQQPSLWSPAALVADFSTRSGMPLQHQLSDGSQLWINAESAVNLAYGIRQRQIHLLCGEVYVASSQKKDPRPLQVVSQGIRFRALGTRFSVTSQPSGLQLNVFDGRVQVTLSNGQSRIVNTRRGLVIQPSGDMTEQPVDINRELWRDGLLVAENMPLQQLLEQLQPHVRGHLGVSDAAASIKVVGTFPLQQPEQVIRMLSLSLPIRLKTTLPWWRTFELETE